MAPPWLRSPQGAPSPRTILTPLTAQQCYANLPTVTCIWLDFCACQLARQIYERNCPLSNCFNKIHWNTLTQGRPWGGTAPRFIINVIKTPNRMTVDHLTYYQVIHPVNFHLKNLTFSLPALRVWGVGTSPLTGAGTTLVDLEHIKNATADPESYTPKDPGYFNHISIRTPPTKL